MVAVIDEEILVIDPVAIDRLEHARQASWKPFACQWNCFLKLNASCGAHALKDLGRRQNSVAKKIGDAACTRHGATRGRMDLAEPGGRAAAPESVGEKGSFTRNWGG